MSNTARFKPHIRLIRASNGKRLWQCRDRLAPFCWGYGVTPKHAYEMFRSEMRAYNGLSR